MPPFNFNPFKEKPVPATGWEQYYKETKNSSPRALLIEAVQHVIQRGSALDIGAGALNESKYLLQNNFEVVTAVDSSPSSLELAKNVNDNRFTFSNTSIEDFEFHPESLDLINAQLSLPLLSKENFRKVWGEIFSSLKKGGIFSGQLFGERDQWGNDQTMNFHTKDEVTELISGFEVIQNEELEKDENTAAGNMKHWHIFNLILKKS